MADDPVKDDPVDEAESLIRRFGDEAEKRVNKILDERLKVDDPEPPKEEPKEGDPENDPEKDPENDPEPKDKTLAQRLGF